MALLDHLTQLDGKAVTSIERIEARRDFKRLKEELLVELEKRKLNPGKNRIQDADAAFCYLRFQLLIYAAK